MNQLKSKVSEVENQVMDLRMISNTKINGEEVKEIIDRKMNVLREYKMDTENLNKKCNEFSQSMKMGLEGLPQIATGEHQRNETISD